MQRITPLILVLCFGCSSDPELPTSSSSFGGSGPILSGPVEEGPARAEIDPDNPWLSGSGGTATAPASSGGNGTGSGDPDDPDGPSTDPNGSGGAPPVVLPPAGELRLVGYEETKGAEKFVTLHHIGGSAVPTGECKLEVYVNGSLEPYRRIELPAFSVDSELMVCTTGASSALCLDVLGPAPFNGDDALIVRCRDGITDSFGRLGEDPGTAWLEDGVSSKDQALVRCGTQTDRTPADEFHIAAEWLTRAPTETVEAARARCPSENSGQGGAPQ